jgi:hypothetical protein
VLASALNVSPGVGQDHSLSSCICNNTERELVIALKKKKKKIHSDLCLLQQQHFEKHILRIAMISLISEKAPRTDAIAMKKKRHSDLCLLLQQHL